MILSRSVLCVVRNVAHPARNKCEGSDRTTYAYGARHVSAAIIRRARLSAVIDERVAARFLLPVAYRDGTKGWTGQRSYRHAPRTAKRGHFGENLTCHLRKFFHMTKFFIGFLSDVAGSECRE